MLRFIAATEPDSFGVFVKRPKPGQDRRVDLPAVGPATVMRVAEAGLSGMELAAGGVLILGAEAVMEAADAAGVAIWTAP